jgi:HAD superfamily hydrolase (TIGR01509 family)
MLEITQKSEIARIASLLKTKEISYILLDMDGTLLDKYFDDYFWGHLVPEKYAEKHKLTFGKAKEELFSKYRSQEGTLNWTDVDYWSRELKLDIIALKEQIRHLIEVHPHVEDFLREMRHRKKHIWIVTNAHYKVLSMKLKKTELGKYLDGAITSFDMGIPKEYLEFWERAQKRIGFKKEKTLFIDDTIDVLRTALRFGIKYLIHKAKANSKVEPVPSSEFISINDFSELLIK